MSTRQLVHGVDPLEGFADRATAPLRRPQVDGPELGVESAFAHARQILMSLFVALVEVPGRVLEPGRGVRVTVDDDRVAVERSSVLSWVEGGERAAEGQESCRSDDPSHEPIPSGFR
jgi:hypothetical protein